MLVEDPRRGGHLTKHLPNTQVFRIAQVSIKMHCKSDAMLIEEEEPFPALAFK